jgi:hypothetical protein
MMHLACRQSLWRRSRCGRARGSSQPRCPAPRPGQHCQMVCARACEGGSVFCGGRLQRMSCRGGLYSQLVASLAMESRACLTGPAPCALPAATPRALVVPLYHLAPGALGGIGAGEGGGPLQASRPKEVSGAHPLGSALARPRARGSTQTCKWHSMRLRIEGHGGWLHGASWGDAHAFWGANPPGQRFWEARIPAQVASEQSFLGVS